MGGWNKGIKIDRAKYPNFGHFQKHTKETRKKMSITRKKRITTLETKRKMSLTAKRLGRIPPYHKGKDCHFWKGGVTKLQDVIRKSKIYKDLVLSIKERDNFTCQICRVRGGELQTDHFPIPFSIILKNFNIKSLEDALNCSLMWEKSNLRSLCKDCHRKTDTYGYLQRNKDFKEYGIYFIN